MTDLELVQSIKDGDSSALQELAQRYARDLYGLAYSLMGNAADADDMVQQAFLGALRGIGSFEGRSSLKTWLFTILVNQTSKAKRSFRVRRATSIEAAGDVVPDNAVRAGGRGAAHMGGGESSTDSRLDAMEMLETLAPEHRDVMVLRELQQMTYDEIAEALGIPRGTVESRLFRARRFLRERFASYAV